MNISKQLTIKVVYNKNSTLTSKTRYAKTIIEFKNRKNKEYVHKEKQPSLTDIIKYQK